MAGDDGDEKMFPHAVWAFLLCRSCCCIRTDSVRMGDAAGGARVGVDVNVMWIEEVLLRLWTYDHVNVETDAELIRAEDLWNHICLLFA